MTAPTSFTQPQIQPQIQPHRIAYTVLQPATANTILQESWSATTVTRRATHMLVLIDLKKETRIEKITVKNAITPFITIMAGDQHDLEELNAVNVDTNGGERKARKTLAHMCTLLPKTQLCSYKQVKENITKYTEKVRPFRRFPKCVRPEQAFRCVAIWLENFGDLQPMERKEIGLTFVQIFGWEMDEMTQEMKAETEKATAKARAENDAYGALFDRALVK